MEQFVLMTKFEYLPIHYAGIIFNSSRLRDKSAKK